jgi:hypothetical protein
MNLDKAQTIVESFTDYDYRQTIIAVTTKLEPSILKPLLSHEVCICGLADLVKCVLHLV